MTGVAIAERGIYAFREDARFSSTNEWGLPDLRADRLSSVVPTETYDGEGDVAGKVVPFRALATSKMAGAVLCWYVPDWRFEAIWADAVKAVGALYGAGLAAVISPDFSMWRDVKAAGVEVFDASGKMNNMATIMGQLEKHMQGMGAQQRVMALEMMGFKSKTVDAIKPLIGMSEAIKKYEADLRSAGGVTADVAAKQMQGFTAQRHPKPSQVDTAADRAVTRGKAAGRGDR